VISRVFFLQPTPSKILGIHPRHRGIQVHLPSTTHDAQQQTWSFQIPDLTAFGVLIGKTTYVASEYSYMGVSENSGTPKSSILIGFPLKTIHFGVPLFLETPIYNWLVVEPTPLKNIRQNGFSSPNRGVKIKSI